MSFLSYILRTIFKRNRDERIDVKVPCKYCIFSPENEEKQIFENLTEGVLINTSSKGVGIITTPAFDEEIEKKIKNHKIYLEFVSPETDTLMKIKGEVRWIKTVTDVNKPYSEIGILLKNIDENSKKDIFNSLFENTGNNKSG